MIHASPRWPDTVYRGTAVVMLGAFGLTVVLHALDPRLLADGNPVWAKPLKFQMALALHAGTLALVVARMTKPLRDGRLMLYVASAFLAACVVEMGYITLQAALGQPSHFNTSTPLNAAMFSVMAFCAVIIIGTAGMMGVVVWWDTGFRATDLTRLAVVAGLIGGTVLTLVTAFSIGANGGPFVGVDPGPTEKMFLSGWSMVSGDLRISHFLATHMIQAVPAAGLVIGAIAPVSAHRRLLLVFVALWTLLTILAFQDASYGQPEKFFHTGTTQD